jgi:hypothetical protein
VTYSTARPTGLRPRPGHPTINVPGLDPIPVLDKAIAQRPRKPLVTVTADQAARVFEQSYAESMAFRKQQGISTQEVVNTATRKVA